MRLQDTYDVCVVPIGAVQVDPCLPFTANRFPHKPAPSLRIYHQFELVQHVGAPTFGMPIFELDTLKPIEIAHMKYQDVLISCSHWAKRVCEAHGIPSSVVPLGVNLSIFRPSDHRQDRPFTFFNGGKWEIRKGHDLLLEAFSLAFSKRDDVRLKLLCTSPFAHHADYNQKWVELFKKSKNGDKIDILPRCATLNEVANIMQETDCGVFPARAEGWNLELLEMLSMGKVCIAGNYSAPTEYITDKNCFLLEPTKMVPAKDGVWFDGFGSWADYSVDALVELMRRAYKDGPRLNQEGIETAKQFTWENTGAKLAELIG